MGTCHGEVTPERRSQDRPEASGEARAPGPRRWWPEAARGTNESRSSGSPRNRSGKGFTRVGAALGVGGGGRCAPCPAHRRVPGSTSVRGRGRRPGLDYRFPCSRTRSALGPDLTPRLTWVWGQPPHPRVLIPAQPLMSRMTLGRAPELPVPQFPPGDNHSTHVRVSTSTAQSMCTASAQ